VNVICGRAGCVNEGIDVPIKDWDGAQIVCGPCGTVLEGQAEWYEPPTPEELGIEPAPQRAADLIANMTDAERAELAALIAPPTLQQVKKQ